MKKKVQTQVNMGQSFIDGLPELEFYNEEIIKEEVKPIKSNIVVQEPGDFDTAVRNAQRQGLKYVEVSDKLFDHLASRSDMNAFTRGSPGIIVVKEGKVAEFERMLSLNTDEWHLLELKKKSAHA